MGEGDRSSITRIGKIRGNSSSTQGEKKETGNTNERIGKFAKITSKDNPVFAEIANTMIEPNFSHVWARFDQLPDTLLGFFYYTACLQCEASEVFNHAKKAIVKGESLDKTKVGDELVDVLWYTLAVANMLEIELSDAAKRKCEELLIRIRSDYYSGANQNA